MQREEMMHVARAAADVAGVTRVLVLGSQAVLGVVEEDAIPEEALRSVELDVVVVDAHPGNPAQQIAATIGEQSPFHVEYGYFADGMTIEEAALPKGWEGRLRTVEATRATDPDVPVQILCPELHDLCASKLSRGAGKDIGFVKVLVRAGLVDTDLLIERCRALPETALGRTRAISVAESIGSGRTEIAADQVLEEPPYEQEQMTDAGMLVGRRQQCRAELVDGRDCTNRAQPGSAYCGIHQRTND